MSSPAPAHPDAPSSRPGLVLMAGVLGNALEWYDFGLFGYFTPILSRLFFPQESQLAALLATYGIFAVGFLMRPLGGLFFGYIGDRWGRKSALQWSVLLMAVPTTLVGLMPTYAQIGLAAPLLLTALRLLQGLSVGGEFIGSISFLGEHAAARRRGFFSSWACVTATGGVLLGSGVAAVMTHFLTPEQLASWGWRLPFLAGLAVGLVGAWIRQEVAESPAFVAAVHAGRVTHNPIAQALRRDAGALFTVVGLALLMAVGFYLTYVWVPTWLADVNEPRLPAALTVNTLTMACMLPFVVLSGWWSDRVGRRSILIGSCLASILVPYPAFALLRQGTFGLALAGQAMLGLCNAFLSGTAAVAYLELFPTATRYSAVGLAYNGAMALFGGTAPFLATWLIESTGQPMAPACYLSGCAAVAAVAALGFRPRHDLAIEQTTLRSPGESPMATVTAREK